MDGEQVRGWEGRCIEEQQPACNATCPVHVDARGMATLMAKGDFEAAFSLFARVIPFPAIISCICDHPCESACRRAERGGAIRIHELEKACVNFGFEALPFRPLRARDKRRIVIVGAGLSGLTAAMDLALKGHDVTLLEAQSWVLDRLTRYDRHVLPESVLAADIARIHGSSIELRLGSPLTCDGSGPELADLIEAYDAVYLGIGPEPLAGIDGLLTVNANGRIAIDPLTFATSHPKVFAGGGQRYGTGYSPITSVHDGRYAALSIERLFQGASLTANRESQGPQTTRLFVNTHRHAVAPPVQPLDPARGYTHDESIAEARRCFPCHCLECVQVCPYLEHYGSYPKRYIREIYNNETIVMGQRKSNRMIDSCTLCGLCAEVCPEDLGMGEVCLSARQGMVEKGRMPVSHHDFALRDLAFSRSDAFTLARHQPGFASTALLFFPGCQLSASSPDHVAKVYAHLCERVDRGVGLMLGCCGAPAHWAARNDLFDATRAEFRAEWERLGKPPVVTACSSCFRMFTDHQPDVNVESLWTLLERVGLPDGHGVPRGLTIHDPCTTRHETAIHASVRRLAAQRGAAIAELDGAERTTCCGFGGLAQFANREIADKIVDRRIGQSDADYLTYCAMCRDNFARRGKRALHFLDLVFIDGDPAARRDPGFSARQENRGRLKRRLLRDVWRENVTEPTEDILLTVAADVQADIEKKLILEDDIRQTIRHAETSGRKLLDKKSGHFVACHRPVAITYWVEYTIENGHYVVHRAYSHRMDLEATS